MSPPPFSLLKCAWTGDLYSPDWGPYYVYEAVINADSHTPSLLTYIGGLAPGEPHAWAWMSMEDGLVGLGGEIVQRTDFATYEELLEYALASGLGFLYAGLKFAL